MIAVVAPKTCPGCRKPMTARTWPPRTVRWCSHCRQTVTYITEENP